MARSFNGTSDRLNSGSAGIDNVTSKISFSAWIYVASAPATGVQQTIAGNGAAAGGRNWVFDYRNISGTLQLEASWTVGGSFAEERAVTTLTTNTWHHVAFQNDHSLIPYVPLWYVDGSPLTTTNSGSITSGTPPQSSTIIIGVGNLNNSAFFNGRLADVAVWSGITLTALEVKALSQGARPWTIRKPSLLAWWPLDGVQSPEPDLSGNATSAVVSNLTVTGTALAFGPPLTPFSPRWPMGSLLQLPPIPPLTLMPQIVT